MNMRVMAGRVVVKQHATKLKGAIQLLPNRAKLYEIGEVIAVGAMEGYGPDGKHSTKETYIAGDLVLFQLPPSLVESLTFDIKGVLNCFLHVEDIIARLTRDVIELESFKIVGRFVLIEPSVRRESLIVLPDTAEDAKRENLHFSVRQVGADVGYPFYTGQEVFPDKGRVNPMIIENTELAFVDQQFIYGALATD